MTSKLMTTVEEQFFRIFHVFKKKNGMPIQIINFTHRVAHLRLSKGRGTASMTIEASQKSPVELDNSVVPDSIAWWNESESDQQRFDIGASARRILSTGGVVTVELKTKKQLEMWKRYERESGVRSSVLISQ